MASDVKSVLIVDDDVEFSEMVEYCLINDGFVVYQAFNGLEAMEIAKKKRPSVILLDIMMPVMDGHDVLRELRNSRKTKELPVFMFSSKSLMEDVEKALSAGADDYILKATDADELGKVIRAKLENMMQGADEKS